MSKRWGVDPRIPVQKFIQSIFAPEKAKGFWVKYWVVCSVRRTPREIPADINQKPSKNIVTWNQNVLLYFANIQTKAIVSIISAVTPFWRRRLFPVESTALRRTNLSKPFRLELPSYTNKESPLVLRCLDERELVRWVLKTYGFNKNALEVPFQRTLFDG